jgi:ADP-heptose:LPS heptosyltransferase
MGWKDEVFDTAVWAASLFHRTAPDPRLRPPREILVLRPGDYGDLLTTTPIFEALRRRFPGTRLVAGVGSWGRTLVENNPFVDEIVTLDAPWCNKFVPESGEAALRFLFHSPQVEELRRCGGFDVGIDILGSHYGSALMLRLGVRHRIGVRDFRRGWRACQQYSLFSMHTHVARAALAQAELLGATDLPEARPQFYPTAAECAEAGLLWNQAAPPNTLKLLVGCGSGQPTKTWPADSVATALRQFSDALGVESGVNILLLGGPADRERANQIITTGPPGIRALCGETSLRVSFALAEQADLVLTNSSMLLHAAAAFRRPTLAVLGPFHADQDHDALWGYPPPYGSVGPTDGTWPSVEAVVAALVAAAQACNRDRA